MRRTVLSLLALAGTAVVVGSGPAFAGGGTTPTPVPASERPAETTAPTARPEPTRPESARPESARPTPARPAPTRAPADRQVTVVPSGAPDTGVTADAGPASGGTAVGAGAAAVLALGGGTVVVVRRRRASGA
ncbi:sortase-dependent protein [Streptomyces sp. NPDC017943]|uniref:sortase-dependent protein n=1 Tax=Streptomyces sp. NPDC017943 TaxID=3365019 RepID=UPI003788BFEB